MRMKQAMFFCQCRVRAESEKQIHNCGSQGGGYEQYRIAVSVIRRYVRETSFLYEPSILPWRTDNVFGRERRKKFLPYINPLNTKRRLLYLKTQFVPRSKHFSSRL